MCDVAKDVPISSISIEISQIFEKVKKLLKKFFLIFFEKFTDFR